MDVELVVAPAERAPETVPAAAPQEHREVELADVPSRQHVGIDAADVREQLDEQRALVGEDLRACYGPFADHQDALAAGARQRDGVETARVEARLDVERQHAQLRREVGGLEGRVPVDAADARTAFERSRHRERALQTAVDQIARNVSLIQHDRDWSARPVAGRALHSIGFA